MMARTKITEQAQGQGVAGEMPPYSMRIDWDPDDRIFVVTVPELEGCMTHGATYEEAARNGREAIASWLGAARIFGDPIPAPRVVPHRLDQEGEAPPTVETEQAIRFALGVIRLLPTSQSIPAWVLDELRPFAQGIHRLSLPAQISHAQAALSPEARGWLLGFAARLLGDTGEPSPALSQPGQVEERSRG